MRKTHPAPQSGTHTLYILLCDGQLRAATREGSGETQAKTMLFYLRVLETRGMTGRTEPCQKNPSLIQVGGRMITVFTTGSTGSSGGQAGKQFRVSLIGPFQWAPGFSLLTSPGKIKAAGYCFISHMSPNRGLWLCICFYIKGTLLAGPFKNWLASWEILSHKPGSNF